MEGRNTRVLVIKSNFETIIAASQPVVLAGVRRHLIQQDFAQDVIQDIYLILYRLWRREKLAHVEKLDAYVYQLARHECYRYNRQLMGQAISLEDEGSVMAVDGGLLPNDEYQALHDAVAQLPERYRDIMGYLLKGYSLVELSEKLSININTLKSYAKRAREKLFGILSHQEDQL